MRRYPLGSCPHGMSTCSTAGLPQICGLPISISCAIPHVWFIFRLQKFFAAKHDPAYTFYRRVRKVLPVNVARDRVSAFLECSSRQHPYRIGLRDYDFKSASLNLSTILAYYKGEGNQVWTLYVLKSHALSTSAC